MSDLFERVARAGTIAPPPPIRGTADEWAAFCRSVWARFPPWGYDEFYVAELAADFLPRVLAQMGTGRLVGRLAPGASAIAGKYAPASAFPLDDAGEGEWLLFRATPGASESLVIHEASHAWMCPILSAAGSGMISLGAWRWGISEAKAAWRIARLCAARRPVPL